MTDEERLEELEQKRKEISDAINELRNLDEKRKLLCDMHNEMLREINALKKRIEYQNKLLGLGGDKE